jgi:phage head maturation protease
VTIELTDDRGLTGNLTLLDEDDDGDEVLRIVYGVHWDDPFPEDAQ